MVRTRPRRRAFTLVEILVVLAIILLVSVIAIPATWRALNGRQVTDAARIFTGALVGARDAAIRANKPRGIRLLPDPTLTIPPPGSPGAGSIQLVYNRMLAIEPAAGISDGRISLGPMPIPSATFPPPYPPGGVYPFPSAITGNPEVLMLEESPYRGGFITATGAPNTPTSFYWNVRLGDTIKIGYGTSGRSYTVVGPCTVNPNGTGAFNGNDELYVNVGPPGTTSPLDRTYYNPNGTVFAKHAPEFLFLVNGGDDDGDGWVDEGWDGQNQNPPQPAAPASPAVANPNYPAGPYDQVADDLSEWETETWVVAFRPALSDPAQTAAASPSFAWAAANLQGVIDAGYTLNRRPVPSPGARETMLPGGVVIDATTWNSTQERSRLPIEANTLHCDIMLTTQGRYMATPAYSSPASASTVPFLHFLLCERADVYSDGVLWRTPSGAPAPNPSGAGLYRLPMPTDALGFNAGGILVSGGFYPPTPPAGSPPFPVLKGDRRLITLFGQSGLVVTNTTEAVAPTPGVPIPGEGFNVGDVSYPFLRAQLGQLGEK